MKRLAGLIVLLAGLILALPAHAGDLIVSRALLEDPTGALRIDDVVQREFKPTGLTFHEGYSRSAFWLRIVIRVPDPGNPAVLLIRQPYLDEIRLFEATAGPASDWPERATGTRYAFETRERLGATLAFFLKPQSTESTYYLRLQTDVTAQMTVEALTPLEAQARVHQLDLLQVFFATSMLALLLWAVHSYWLDRQPVIGLFALHQAAYVAYGTIVTGYLAPALPHFVDGFANELWTLSYCAVGFTPLLFCRALFRYYAPPPLLMRGLNLLLLVFPLQLVAIALGYLAWAAIANFVLVRISWWYLTLMTFTLRRERKPSRRMLQIVFGCATLLFTAFWLSYYGSPSDTENYLYGRQLLIANGLIIGVLFAALLSAHSRKVQQEAQKSQTRLAITRKTLELERKQKTEAEVLARTDYLTGLFNRRHFFEQAELEVDRAIRYERPLALIMIDIDHFKAVNDTWGHGVGDQVLCRVSLLVRETLRSVDLFGRTGGEEFAAILVETEETDAMGVAERLRATVAAASIESGAQDADAIRVSISIGMTTLNNRQVGFGELMNEADRALYQAKQTGRNHVVCIHSTQADQNPRHPDASSRSV